LTAAASTGVGALMQSREESALRWGWRLPGGSCPGAS
jgi:hypothetical protein